MPPNSFALARSVEYFRIPRDVVTVTVGKSTYARCGIITNVTPFEPEWEGYVTLEISNTTPLPAKIYANEGIAQVLFFKGRRSRRSPTGQEGEVPGAERRDAAAHLSGSATEAEQIYEHCGDREEGEDAPTSCPAPQPAPTRADGAPAGGCADGSVPLPVT